jgi:predicted RNA-binding protein with PIN domain
VILKFCVIDFFQYWSNIRKKEELIVVFDGRGSGVSYKSNISGIDVVFPRPGLDADEEIKRMVSKSKRPREIMVVTSDREIKRFVEKCGSKVMEPLEFYRHVTKKIVRQTAGGRGHKRIMRDKGEPISKYTGPTKSEAQHWLKVFSDKTGKDSDD